MVFPWNELEKNPSIYGSLYLDKFFHIWTCEVHQLLHHRVTDIYVILHLQFHHFSITFFHFLRTTWPKILVEFSKNRMDMVILVFMQCKLRRNFPSYVRIFNLTRDREM